jgi:ATP-dependent RNA helicase DDX35
LNRVVCVCRLNAREQLKVVPIYAGLSAEQQLKVFESTLRYTRKCVVATNIAETSITIDGVVYVVDCGFVKVFFFDSVRIRFFRSH